MALTLDESLRLETAITVSGYAPTGPELDRLKATFETDGKPADLGAWIQRRVSVPPTLAAMSDRQRQDYVAAHGAHAYTERLMRELRTAGAERRAAEAAAGQQAFRAMRESRNAPPAPPVAPSPPPAHMSESADLASLTDQQRGEWIKRHGAAKYTATLLEQSKGRRTLFGGRR